MVYDISHTKITISSSEFNYGLANPFVNTDALIDEIFIMYGMSSEKISKKK